MEQRTAYRIYWILALGIDAYSISAFILNILASIYFFCMYLSQFYQSFSSHIGIIIIDNNNNKLFSRDFTLLCTHT